MAGVTDVLKNFNGGVFFSELVGKKTGRFIGAFLNGIGADNLKKFVSEGIDLTDVFDEEAKANFKMMAMPYAKIISTLAPEVAYQWLPPEYLGFFKSLPNGKAWAIKQLGIIKDFLIA
jgi:hypothetical protein